MGLEERAGRAGQAKPGARCSAPRLACVRSVGAREAGRGWVPKCQSFSGKGGGTFVKHTCQEGDEKHPAARGCGSVQTGRAALSTPTMCHRAGLPVFTPPPWKSERRGELSAK